MPAPTMAEVRALAGERVRVTVPKPREDQRMVGEIALEDDTVVFHVDTGGTDVGADHSRIELRERPRDGVVRAFRGPEWGVLVGRVARVDVLDGSE